MSWRTTGLLFIALVVVAAVVFLQSRQTEPENDGLPTAAPVVETTDLFGDVEEPDVVRLDVQAASNREASFSREPGGNWVMTVPTSTAVITQTVTNAVTGLINTSSRRTFAPDENPLDAYGLVDPARQIIVAVEREGQIVRHLLQIGNETPAGDAYYVLKEGDRRVHLMTKTTLDNVFELATQPPLPETLPTPDPTLEASSTVPLATPTVASTPGP